MERYNVVADFVEMCAYCGVACSGTVVIWYESDGRKLAFEVDRPTVWDLFDELVKVAIGENQYESLPSFVREYNEGCGWTSTSNSTGAPVKAEDLLNSVELLRPKSSDVPQEVRMLDGLAHFVANAAAEGKELWAVET